MILVSCPVHTISAENVWKEFLREMCGMFFGGHPLSSVPHAGRKLLSLESTACRSTIPWKVSWRSTTKSKWLPKCLCAKCTAGNPLTFFAGQTCSWSVGFVPPVVTTQSMFSVPLKKLIPRRSGLLKPCFRALKLGVVGMLSHGWIP